MHVKSHDQVLNVLEPVPYSLFFSVELYFIASCHRLTHTSQTGTKTRKAKKGTKGCASCIIATAHGS